MERDSERNTKVGEGRGMKGPKVRKGVWGLEIFFGHRFPLGIGLSFRHGVALC